MGKGKGANFEKVAPIKAGQILCSVGIVNLQNRELVKLLIQKLSFKIPFKHKVILNT
jgi:ribosomal protein L16/L10AE